MYYTLIRLGTDFPKWSPISTLRRQWYRYDSSTQFLQWDKLGLPCSNMLKTCIYPANPSSSSSSKHDCISEEHNSIFACVIASKYTYLHISHICISSQIYIYIYVQRQVTTTCHLPPTPTHKLGDQESQTNGVQCLAFLRRTTPKMIINVATRLPCLKRAQQTIQNHHVKKSNSVYNQGKPTNVLVPSSLWHPSWPACQSRKRRTLARTSTCHHQKHPNKNRASLQDLGGEGPKNISEVWLQPGLQQA